MSDTALKITRSERALLRGLVEEAWEAELGAELEKLFEDFTQWADNGMSAHELSDRIHQFHDGPARKIYSLYTSTDPGIAVARAIAIGFLDEQAIDEQLRAKLADQIETFRRVNADE